MQTYSLTLYPSNKVSMTVPLHPGQTGRSLLDDIHLSDNNVYAEMEYEALLSGDNISEVREISFYINDEKVVCNYNNGTISFRHVGFGRRIFCDCYGFAQIEIILEFDGENISLRSEYLPVLVRKGKLNDSVQRMAKFVYDNYEELLYGNDIHPRNLSGMKESDYKSLESRLLLLNRMAGLYEENFSYFKANSRFKSEPKEYVDRFEKLQFITNSTIQHISQHPEELEQVNYTTGITYLQHNMQPKRTLISRNMYTYDIYENQIIVGFLKTVIAAIVDIKHRVEQTLNKIPAREVEIDGYVTSAFFIFSSTKKILESYHGELLMLENRFIALYGAYSDILKVKEAIVSVVPKPTAVFLAIPQYHVIFNSILEWFKYGICDLLREQFMLTFLRSSTLYECYLLTKLNKYFVEHGFERSGHNTYSYPMRKNARYRNTRFSNTFVFRRGENLTVTVYYQPVIYDKDYQHNGIGLHRTTSIVIADDSPEERIGRYYAPDYILKMETSKITRYVILDAKFSTCSTIKNFYFSKLAYKYVFSVSTINPENVLAGFCVINGITENDETDVLRDAYDYRLPNEFITPDASIMTLTEMSEDNELFHSSLLSQLIYKYLL